MFGSRISRWQREIRAAQNFSEAQEQASYLRDQRRAIARQLLRVQENLTNVTAAYIDACRRAGVKP